MPSKAASIDLWQQCIRLRANEHSHMPRPAPDQDYASNSYITVLHESIPYDLPGTLDFTQADDVGRLIGESIADAMRAGPCFQMSYTCRFRIMSVGHDGAVDMYLEFYRRETDLECNTRLTTMDKLRQKTARDAAPAKERRRQQYLKLKAEFEDQE